jgi:hypothetical protein
MLRRPTTFGDDGRQLGRSPRRLLLLLLLLGLALPGCSGCSDSSAQKGQAPKSAEEIEKEREELEKKKRDAQRPPVDLGRMQTLPADAAVTRNLAKPGHWSVATQAVRANQNDVQAEFETLVVDDSGTPVEMERAPFRLLTSRPAALPKTQSKYLETMFFVPRVSKSSAQTRLQRRLLPRSGSRAEIIDQQLVDAMSDHEYFLVVLAETPDRYLFLRHLHSIKPPTNIELERETVYYHVVIPEIESGIALPSQPLAWTSISCLLWDNIHPNSLTPEQQQALVDWLHWGGQVIVSGPGSLEKLTGSFLEPLLPAAADGSVELQQADLDELNANWSLFSQKSNAALTLQLNDGKPLLSTRLAPKGSGRAMEGTGGLICETAVGRGRIVVSGFSLVDRRVLSWGGLDGFVNGCLLRRPARVFKTSEFQDTADVAWNEHASLNFDARMNSRLRYFSRDAWDNLRDSNKKGAESRASSAREMLDDPWGIYGWTSSPQSGVGGWNDHSAVAAAARETLKEAAGISIPESRFVLKVLAVYLLLLVPVNWLFFRLLGRVELAWIAAPLLAVVASVTVVRVAQLDIGFARSRTEVATLELQTGYARGHLTRYTALYTSLSSTYELAFDDPSAQALPFSTNPEYVRRRHDPLTTVTVRRDRQLRLAGFSVISNSTGMLHSEQMCGMGGALRLSGADASRLVNDTEMLIRDAIVMRRGADGALVSVLVPVLQPKTAVVLDLKPSADLETLAQQWRSSPVMSGHGLQPGEISLQLLVDTAARQLPLLRGETRLVGWTDHDFQGLEIRPASNQSLVRTLVLAQLAPPAWSPAERDVNLYVDVVRVIEPGTLTDELLRKIQEETQPNPNP